MNTRLVLQPLQVPPMSAVDAGLAVPDLSFVIPARDEEACIRVTLRQVHSAAKSLVDAHEIIVVDDGSRDRTLDAASALCGELPLTVLRLSRNFGKEQAIMAGLRQARGAAVVILDADMQEPVSALANMIEKHRAGWEMVYAVRAHRNDEGGAKRTFVRAFYRLVNIGAEIDIPQDARDFRLLDRRVVDALLALPERNRFMKGLYGWVGFRSIAVPVEIAPRVDGRSKFGVQGLWRLGVTGITAFTNWPLRVWTGLGMVVAAVALIYGALLLARTLIFGTDVPGWSTLAVGIFVLGGVQLISIGVLGEYLARVFTEVKGRPGYIVAEVRRAEAIEEQA